MLGPRLSTLSEDAREQVAFAVNGIRDALGDIEHGSTSAESTRSEALGRILSLAAPRLRDLVAGKGAPDSDGTVSLVIQGEGGRYHLSLGTGRSGRGTPVPEMQVAGPRQGGRDGLLFGARFFDDAPRGPWSAGRGRPDDELAILAALDALSPHLPAGDGSLSANASLDFTAEAEMVRADGGFPGATCREYLDALRNEVVRGMMAGAVHAVAATAVLQEKAGYVWGARYLAYDDTDKRSCRVPVERAVACFHSNVDLIDDHAAWIVGAEPGADGAPARLSVWGFRRGKDDPAEAAEAAMAGGLSALGEPHVSLDLVTHAVTVRAGFDPGALAGNVLNGATRDQEVYGRLKATLKEGGAETCRDFGHLSPEGYEEDVEEPASPAP